MVSARRAFAHGTREWDPSPGRANAAEHHGFEPSRTHVSGHALQRAAWFACALASAIAAALPGMFSGPLSILLPVTALAIVPGTWLARRLAPAGTGSRMALALLCAPAVGGAFLALARAAGLDAVGSARSLAAVSAVLAAWEALHANGSHPNVRERPVALGFALVVGLGIAVVLAIHPALASRSDGAFHAGVVWAALRQLPPEDPFFAGLPLRYFWGQHAWSAGWLALAPSIGAYAPLVWANATAAVAALLAVAALARRLGSGARGEVLAQGLALAGGAPFAWLVLAGRASSGDVRGLEEWRQALEHGADHALRALDPGWLHPSLVLPLDKFVVLTPFAWALAATSLAALALADTLERTDARAALRLAAVVAAASFLHPVGGLAVAGAVLAGTVVNAVRASGARAGALNALVAVTGALLVLAPWFASLATPEPGGEPVASARLGFHWPGVTSVFVAGAWLVPPALLVLVRRERGETLRPALLAMLAALVSPACFVQLGGDNQSKFVSLAFLLCAAPAARAWSGAPRGVRGVAFAMLALSALPTLACVGWAYAHQSSHSEDSPSRPAAAIVRAVAELSPREAVLVDATLDTTRGAAPALAGESGRALLWSGTFMARKWGHDPGALRLREAAAAALAAGEWPAGEAGSLLDSLARELWVVRAEDASHASAPGERVVVRTGGTRLVRIERPPR